MSKIAVIGLGLIGGSIAKALRNSNKEIYIGAFDKHDTLNRASDEGFIDEAISDIRNLEKYNLIFLCLPIRESIEYFEKIASRLQPNQILTDVCSVKLPFAKRWEKINSAGAYIGGHPMTGKEHGGYENSDALLFENSIYILTEEPEANSQSKVISEIISLLGANILTIPAKQHDIIAASVSHLPQLLSVALVNTAAVKTDKYNFLDLAAGGFRDMTRIAESDFKIWESIISENRNEIVTAIEEFEHELAHLKDNINANDYSGLGSEFNRARNSRHEIPVNTKGFLKPLFDVFIFVKDEPGVLSKISSALFDEGINIKDIELLKIREGAGGTFRVAFSDKSDAERAKSVLKSAGYQVN